MCFYFLFYVYHNFLKLYLFIHIGLLLGPFCLRGIEEERDFALILLLPIKTGVLRKESQPEIFICK